MGNGAGTAKTGGLVRFLSSWHIIDIMDFLSFLHILLKFVKQPGIL
jgi:hypothetical protein